MHVYIISYMLYIEPYMYYISVTLILVGLLGHFIRVSITTLIAFALKKYYYTYSFLEAPAGTVF
jgi:hypothetical protein